MYNHNFAKNLAEIAGKHNIPPFLLEIEITESAFSANQKPLIDLIESLHCYGFLVSIDDFGSGYSSLNLIKELKFDVIKIDQVFFRNIHDVTRAKSVIQCILALAKELGMRTVAEGVETEEQFKFLKDNSCDTIQGFYFSRPLEENIFTQLLASNDSADI
jgi:EAL domain-containing protein (putative c-di-GMP-specific phosphodiesterase class I)